MELKFSLFRNFGALNSSPIFDAFERSLISRGFTVSNNDMEADVAVIWSMLWNGRMSNNKNVWHYYRSRNKPVVILEVGALDRGNLWRIAVNSIDNTGFYGKKGNNSNRRNRLGIKISKKSQGEHILICTQNPLSHLWRNQPNIDEWVRKTVTEIRLYTDRHIILRPHPRFRGISCNLNQFKNVTLHTPRKLENTYDSYDFDHELNNAYAVINWNSNPAIIAALSGVPVFVGENSLALPVSNIDLSKINEPQVFDRDQWANDLAYSEWSIDEIEKGLALDNIITELTY